MGHLVQLSSLKTNWPSKIKNLLSEKYNEEVKNFYELTRANQVYVTSTLARYIATIAAWHRAVSLVLALLNINCSKFFIILLILSMCLLSLFLINLLPLCLDFVFTPVVHINTS